jgi:hypothetical protein
MGSSGSEIKLFEKRDDIKEKFQLEESYIIPGNYGNVLEMTIGLDELLICGMERHQLLSCSLSSLHSLKDHNGGNAAPSAHHGGGHSAHHGHGAHHGHHGGSVHGHDKSSSASSTSGAHLSIFENVFTSFHYPNNRGDCEITGIDVALWKQVVVTCGKDRTLRVWNPVDKKMELTKEFDDEPLSLSVHPSGIYVVVAFTDKVKLLSLLLEEVYLCREISARQISYVKFSKGGQYFAVAIGTNLQIYQTYTGLQIATLRGHNNRIKSVLWMNYDSRIVTFGAEGIVNGWDLFPNVSKRGENYNGNIPIQCGVGPVDGSVVFIALNDRQLKELSFVRQETSSSSSTAVTTTTNNAASSSNAPNSNNNAANNAGNAPSNSGGGGSSDKTTVETVIKVTKSLDMNYLVSTMLFDENRRYLIMGTVNNDGGPSGIAVTMTSPSLGGGVAGSNSAPLIDLNLFHSGPVTAICQSYDGNTIYSADINGCIVISEFESGSSSSANASASAAAAAIAADKSGNAALKSPVKQREGMVAFEFIEEVVIHKQDLQNRQNQILSLTQTVDDLNKNNEHQLRLKDMEHKDKLKEIVDSFHLQLSAEKMKYDELENEKHGIEKEFNKKVKNVEEKQIEELSLLEKKYKSKYNAEENRHKLLMEETLEAHKKWNEENELLVLSHQKYLSELTEDYDFKLAKVKSLIVCALCFCSNLLSSFLSHLGTKITKRNSKRKRSSFCNT